MKGLILTGCAGFIGLNFLNCFFADRTLRSIYTCIISIDKLGYATKYNMMYYNVICKSNDVIRVDADINDIEKMKSFYDPTSQTECHINWDVLDFASESHVDNSIKTPELIFSQNASLPANIIKWIGGVSKINSYFHISTDEVYGDIELEDVKYKKNYFTTSSPFKPSNPYSASKVAQDMYLYSMNKTFGLPVTIIRMANQFGPHQHIEKMIPASIMRALANQSIKIYGKGENMRQWTWVEDTVKIIRNLLLSPLRTKNYEVVHISDERNLITNNELVDKLITALSKYNINASKEYIEDRKGHDLAYALLATYSNFGSTLDKRIEELVKWYITQNKQGTYGTNNKI